MSPLRMPPMCRTTVRPWWLLAWAVADMGAAPLAAQPAFDPAAVTVEGRGPTTFVLLTGLVGGVAGFRRLEVRLLRAGHRVVVVDPYRLSIDAADVTFAALARRVDAVLEHYDVDSAVVVGHAHGAGVALRLAASAPHRAAELCFLDVGALPDHRSPVFSASLRLVPLIVRIPGGRRFVRGRFLQGLRESAGRHEWLDAATRRSYTEPLLDEIGRVVAMARRLARADEPEPLPAVVARVGVPVTVLLGSAPHTAGPVPGEIEALEPLGPLLRIEHLPGVGHFPHEEAPDDVARRLLVTHSVRSAPQASPSTPRPHRSLAGHR